MLVLGLRLAFRVMVSDFVGELQSSPTEIIYTSCAQRPARATLRIYESSRGTTRRHTKRLSTGCGCWLGVEPSGRRGSLIDDRRPPSF